MSDTQWGVGHVVFKDRMPPLPDEDLTEAQRKVAQALIAGPRGGVNGPFVPLLRTPELVDSLGSVGAYLRFGSSLQPRISEFLMLVVSREWSQQFEWAVHVPLALKAGVKQEVIATLAEGSRPRGMAEDEALAYDLCSELFRAKGLSETTYRSAVEQFGETGLIDVLAVAGYFTMISMIMNVAHTPPPNHTKGAPLFPYPR